MPATWRRWTGTDFVTGGTWRRWTGTEWEPPIAPPLDADAQAFTDAAAITDDSLIATISDLVTALKDAGVWTKLHALWPLVGGTAHAHKFNLLDPRDVDAAYRLSFNGMWIHDGSGAQPDGATGYADTHLSPTAVLTTSSGSLGIYCRTAAAGAGQPYDLACDDGDTNPVIVIARYTSGNYYCCYTDNSFGPSGPSSDARGFWATNRNSGATTQAIKDGSVVNSLTHAVTMPNIARTLYLGANNRAGTATYWSAKQYALAFVGDGMTSGELADFYDAVQDFQTALGRQV